MSYTILGGGLSGLTAAYRLSSRLPTAKVSIVDSADRLGGWIKSTTRKVGNGSVVLESGPRSIRPRGSIGAPAMLQLICDLGLRDSIIPIPKTHPSAKNRYILSPSHQLKPLSLNPFNSAISLSTLLAASFEPLRARRNVDTVDESVDSFLRRRFGSGVAQLASAGLHGIYAAATTDLSAQAVLGKVYDFENKYGSVLIGAWRDGRSPRAREQKAEEKARWDRLGALGKEREAWAMYGLQGGLETLTTRLAEACRQNGVDMRSEETVKSLEATECGIRVTTTADTLSTTHLISAIPPPALAALIPSLDIPLHPRTSVGVVSLVLPLPPARIHPEGFGYLIPRSLTPSDNPHGILGVVFDSTALPGLDSARDVTKLTVMMGGPYWSSYRPMIARPTKALDLIPLAMDHLRSVFSLQGVEPLIAEAALHIDCIPTPPPGYLQQTRRLHAQILDGRWKGRLSLAGNAWGGIGVNDSVFAAEEVVQGLERGQIVTGLERWA